MKKTPKIGVLLLNMGGPEKQEDVRSFLVNLFSDREIIKLGPAFMQKPLAHWIAWKRAKKSKNNYQKIGGGSPLRRLSEQQAAALEQALQPHGQFIVRVCMRYWHPFTANALDEMRNADVEQIIALPLYPHYSKATTGSSLLALHKELNAIQRDEGRDLSLHVIKSWPDAPLYIAALAKRLAEAQECLHEESNESVSILYSAHSLPTSFIEEGDPYVDDLQRTITALEAKTGYKGQLCYQSRSGPVDWLEPSTPDTIQALAKQGCKNVLVLPLSFVSDHIETLQEIDMEYRELAEGLGMNFACTRGLNNEPLFIDALKGLVLQALSEL